MRHPNRSGPVDAAIFDTDGVITRTADVHERAWRDVLDEAAVAHGVSDRRFRHADYVEHLDGRSRYDGVDSFLRSRGIELPWGDPAAAPSFDTVCGVGNVKNDRFRDVIRSDGVERYESTIELVDRLHDLGVRVAVISASRNCAEVLVAAGVEDRFEVRVDGLDAASLGLVGKPDPAVFTEAALRLGVDVGRCAVIEDSRSGVTAGAAGGFGLVVGVDRSTGADVLRDAGADLVVADLSEIVVDEDRHWHAVGRPRTTEAT